MWQAPVSIEVEVAPSGVLRRACSLPPSSQRAHRAAGLAGASGTELAARAVSVPLKLQYQLLGTCVPLALCQQETPLLEGL